MLRYKSLAQGLGKRVVESDVFEVVDRGPVTAVIELVDTPDIIKQLDNLLVLFCVAASPNF